MELDTGDPVWRSDSPDSRVAVIAALELEAQILRRVWPSGCPRIHVSGPGVERAARAAMEALEAGAERLMSWGLAGGVLPAAVTGSVILPERLQSDDGEWLPDPAWRDRIANVIGRRFRVVGGVLFTSDRVLTTPAAKAELGARTGATAVDMEAAAVARVAAAAGAPFVAVRVIADGPGDALPDEIERLVTADGRTRLAGLPRMLVSPRRFGRLVRLGGRSRQARVVLRRLAESLAGRNP
jgi:adenosylhomocysteine nucleosidase